MHYSRRRRCKHMLIVFYRILYLDYLFMTPLHIYSLHVMHNVCGWSQYLKLRSDNSTTPSENHVTYWKDCFWRLLFKRPEIGRNEVRCLWKTRDCRPLWSAGLRWLQGQATFRRRMLLAFFISVLHDWKVDFSSCVFSVFFLKNRGKRHNVRLQLQRWLLHHTTSCLQSVPIPKVSEARNDAARWFWKFMTISPS